MVLVLVGPVIEEVIFRGYIYLTLKKYGVVQAIFVQSIVFALMHNIFSLKNIMFAFMFGIFAGILAELSENLYPCIACHILVNAIGYLYVGV